MENIDGTWRTIDDFMNELRAANMTDSSLDDMLNCTPLAAQGAKQGTDTKKHL